MYDHDDPPPVEVLDFWYFFNRYAEQCARWARAFGFLTVALCVITEAKAESVCADKQDIYRLAIADIQGTAPEKWRELVAEGVCGNIPVTYLWTLDTYYDKDKEFSRVVVYLAQGTHYYGLRTTLPQNQRIWRIQHESHPQDLGLHNKFYNTWLQPSVLGNPRSTSCCDQKDCYPTVIKKIGDHWFAQRREDLKWIRIPEGKLEHNQGDPRESPDHQSHVCMQPPNYGDNVWCAVLGSGI